jgi:GNAT superfamily N-acetyltransferase
MALGYVRPARDGDTAEIARVQYDTWRIAYPRFIPRFAVDAVRPEWLAEQWAEAVSRPPSDRHRVLVAIEQAEDAPEHLVGFTAIGPADETALAPDETPPEAAPDDAAAATAAPAQAGPGLAAAAAITDLLVEPRWGRRGHGSRLLAAAVELWRSDGFDRAVAWAFAEDVATVKFLGSAGWEPDGATRSLDVEGILVPQARLHVAL